ncbi:hypothetical protein HDU93_000856 [Gonapodya sp. JEL0774]|nr:hypothetical protein HDU93_000856 [Gonapodya sp. JEL0774]
MSAVEEASRRLIQGTEEQSLRLMQLAIKDGADPQARKRVTLQVKLGMFGRKKEVIWAESALAIAIREGKPDLVGFLLEAGADPNLPIDWKISHASPSWREEDWDRRWSHNPSFPSALDLALFSGTLPFNPHGSRVSLISPERDIDTHMEVTLQPSLEVVATLLKHGAAVLDSSLDAAHKFASDQRDRSMESPKPRSLPRTNTGGSLSGRQSAPEDFINLLETYRSMPAPSNNRTSRNSFSSFSPTRTSFSPTRNSFSPTRTSASSNNMRPNSGAFSRSVSPSPARNRSESPGPISSYAAPNPSGANGYLTPTTAASMSHMFPPSRRSRTVGAITPSTSNYNSASSSPNPIHPRSLTASSSALTLINGNGTPDNISPSWSAASHSSAPTSPPDDRRARMENLHARLAAAEKETASLEEKERSVEAKSQDMEKKVKAQREEIADLKRIVQERNADAG